MLRSVLFNLKFHEYILKSSTTFCRRATINTPYHLILRKKLSFEFQHSHCFSISSNFVMDLFINDKARYLNMDLEEKRSQYRCQTKFVTLEQILPWSKLHDKVKSAQSSSVYPKRKSLNERVSLFVGDITALEIDAIVNAANNSLRGGGGVDGAIHRAAGPKLLTECETLNRCPTGEAKITGGYKLPAKFVIHTVGPMGENTELLQNCYQNSLTVAKENGLRTIAFPCVSTGVYGYPNERAAHVALNVVRTFLEQNESSFDRIIFCLFLPLDVGIYENLMQVYFPA